MVLCKQAFCFLTYGLPIPIELWFLFALLGVFLEVEFLIKTHWMNGAITWAGPTTPLSAQRIGYRFTRSRWIWSIHLTVSNSMNSGACIYKQAFCFLTYGLLPIELWFPFALLGVLELEFLIKSPLNEWGYHMGWTHNTSLSSEDRL